MHRENRKFTQGGGYIFWTLFTRTFSRSGESEGGEGKGWGEWKGRGGEDKLTCTFNRLPRPPPLLLTFDKQCHVLLHFLCVLSFLYLSTFLLPFSLFINHLSSFFPSISSIPPFLLIYMTDYLNSSWGHCTNEFHSSTPINVICVYRLEAKHRQFIYMYRVY